MSFSYSKVSTFDQCPYKFKLKYIEKLETKPNLDPDNPLFQGTACHEGIENRSLDKAIESYKSHYYVFTKSHDIEILKLSEILKKAIVQIPEGEYEHKLSGEDGFVGYIDALVKNDDGTYNLLDFKYSNNIKKYKKSGQVHLYKYYFETLTGNKIKNMYYVFIPKCSESYSEDLTDDQLKEKISEYFRDKDIIFERIQYDPQQIEFFFRKKNLMESCKSYEKNPSALCKYCDYYRYCSSNGQDTSELALEEKSDKVEVEPYSLF